MASHVRFAIPDGYEATVSLRPIENGHAAVQFDVPVAPESPPKLWSPDVRRIMARFDDHDSDSNANRLIETMAARGWTPAAPKPHGGGVPPAYILMRYGGGDLGRRITAYVNTLNIQFPPKVAHLAPAVSGELHGDDLWVYHSGPKGDLEKGVAAAEAVAGWVEQPL